MSTALTNRTTCFIVQGFSSGEKFDAQHCPQTHTQSQSSRINLRVAAHCANTQVFDIHKKARVSCTSHTSHMYMLCIYRCEWLLLHSNSVACLRCVCACEICQQPYIHIFTHTHALTRMQDPRSTRTELPHDRSCPDQRVNVLAPLRSVQVRRSFGLVGK